MIKLSMLKLVILYSLFSHPIMFVKAAKTMNEFFYKLTYCYAYFVLMSLLKVDILIVIATFYILMIIVIFVVLFFFEHLRITNSTLCHF
jgi:hypothetical protein